MYTLSAFSENSRGYEVDDYSVDTPVAQDVAVKPQKTDGGFDLYSGISILLNKISKSGSINTKSEFLDLSNDHDMKSKVDYSAYTKASKNNWFFSNDRTITIFGGVHYEVINKNQEAQKSGGFGSYTWVYDDEKASAKNLQSALEEMQELTGLKEFTNVSVPQNIRKLGYVNLKLSMAIS